MGASLRAGGRRAPSTLDVSIGLRIMNLMLESRRNRRLTRRDIAHNLASARHVAERIHVMCAGAGAEESSPDLTDRRPLRALRLRCPYAAEQCAREDPTIVESGAYLLLCFLCQGKGLDGSRTRASAYAGKEKAG